MSCITLLSDFGLQDASVANAKGVLMQYVPEAQYVDISHLVEPHNIQQAAYLLLTVFRNFPKGTCHVLLFDVFGESTPRLILCEYEGQYILAPDNGILSMAFGTDLKQVWVCFELRPPGIFSDWLHEIGQKVAALQNSQPKGLRLPAATLKVATQKWLPIINDHILECHVIHIDHYQNVVINLTRQQFNEIGQGRPFRIEFARNEVVRTLTPHIYSVAEGEKLCRFNATGFLEICINRGKAASLFGLRLYRAESFIYNTIKIYFG